MVAVGFAGNAEKLVKAGRGDPLTHGPVDPERIQEGGEAMDLFVRGLVMNAINELGAFRLQCFSGTDIGLDHHLFDEFMRIETIADFYPDNLAIV